MDYSIFVEHDPIEGVYYVAASDILGLNVEAASLDELFEIICDVIPDLLPTPTCH